MVNRKNVIILGAGLTGLAAANTLESNAIVFEKTARPGGLVKSENYNGYWFDHVLHLLHFKNMTALENKIKTLLGDAMHPLFPEAWVETKEGTSRYPLQMHLSGLNPEAIVKVLSDLAATTFDQTQTPAKNFEEMLRKSFGNYFCELFMLPYNRKVWKRPLNQLAPSGFQWNIDHPDFAKVLTGALTDHTDFKTYNSNGWYPRPPISAQYRGMEVLAKALAEKVEQQLHLNHEVVEIQLNNKTVVVNNNGTLNEYQFNDYCLSTIPLPTLLRCTVDLPEKYRSVAQQLKYNRVVTVMLSIEGPRPENRGHWRYYGEEDLCFTRLIYMHNFDPDSSPKEGWGLMTEITEPAEWPLKSQEEIVAQVIQDVKKANALPDDCTIIDTNMLVLSPAYVVFTEESKKLVQELQEFYESKQLKLLGRYGKWEYSSMAQVMNDGFSWAESVLKKSSHKNEASV